MKVLVLFLCALVAVQGCSTDIRIVNNRSEAALGDQPWLVHIRVAVRAGGVFNTGVGTLISDGWLLTSADVVEDHRYIWLRFGTVNVIKPSLVVETAAVNHSPDRKLALIDIDRYIASGDIISYAFLSRSASVPNSATFCNYGQIDDDVPGEILSCNDLTLATQEDGTIVGTSDSVKASRFDLGSPLVVDGVQVALLVEAGDEDKAGVFLPVKDYLEWIAATTRLSIE